MSEVRLSEFIAQQYTLLELFRRKWAQKTSECSFSLVMPRRDWADQFEAFIDNGDV